MFRWSKRDLDPPPPLFNAAFVRRLQEHLGPAVVRELMDDSLLELTDRLDRLAAFAAENNREALESLLHDIAGAAGHMGLSAMARRATDAGRALREDRAADATRAISPVLECRDESFNALRSFCDAQRSEDG